MHVDIVLTVVPAHSASHVFNRLFSSCIVFHKVGSLLIAMRR